MRPPLESGKWILYGAVAFMYDVVLAGSEARRAKGRDLPGAGYQRPSCLGGERYMVGGRI